jgi:hypothetical protein
VLQQRRRIAVVAEFGCGETIELIGLGVAAGPQIHRQVVFGHRSRISLTHDGRRVVDFQCAHRCVELVDAVAVHTADFQRLDGPSVQDEAQRLEDLSARMRSNSNLKLQRRGVGDFDLDLGAHFSSHSAILRQSFRIRQPCDGAGSGWRVPTSTSAIHEVVRPGGPPSCGGFTATSPIQVR